MLIASSLSAAEPNWLEGFSIYSPETAASSFAIGPDSVRMQAKANPLGKLAGIPEPVIRSVSSTFALEGDFEWNATYDVQQFGLAKAPVPQEANASLTLQCRGAQGHYAINVGVRNGRGPCFNVFHAHPNSLYLHHNMLTLPRTSNKGRLAVRRKGNELVFLVADGQNADLSEVIRLPIRADICPQMTFSTFRGYGPVPPEVDVTFKNMTLKADRTIPDAATRSEPPALGPSKPYGVKLDYSQQSNRLVADFKGAAKTNAVFSPVPGGLRIHPPVLESYDKKATTYFRRESKFSLEGDFEISWKSEITALGPYGDEGGGGAGYSVILVGDGLVGHYGLGFGGSNDIPRNYSITAEIPCRNGTRNDKQALRTNAPKARLAIRRIGTELTFLVQEPQDAVPRVLTTLPYNAGRVPCLRLVASQWNNCTNLLDATISELVVQAERIVDADTNKAIGTSADSAGSEPVTLDSLPQATTNKWRNLKIAAIVLGVALALVGVGLVTHHAFRNKRRS